MKEPKLPRKLNRACKLTEEDITNIWAMKSMDLTQAEIASHFNVTPQAIWYVLQSDDRRKEINYRRHLRDTKKDKIKANQASSEARKYKRKMLKDEMRNAQKLNTEEWRKTHPEYNKTAMKKHYYKEKIGDKWFGAIERKSYRNTNEVESDITL